MACHCSKWQCREREQWQSNLLLATSDRRWFHPYHGNHTYVLLVCNYFFHWGFFPIKNAFSLSVLFPLSTLCRNFVLAMLYLCSCGVLLVRYFVFVNVMNLCRQLSQLHSHPSGKASYRGGLYSMTQYGYIKWRYTIRSLRAEHRKWQEKVLNYCIMWY